MVFLLIYITGNVSAAFEWSWMLNAVIVNILASLNFHFTISAKATPPPSLVQLRWRMEWRGVIFQALVFFCTHVPFVPGGNPSVPRYITAHSCGDFVSLVVNIWSTYEFKLGDNNPGTARILRRNLRHSHILEGERQESSDTHTLFTEGRMGIV